MSKINRQSIFRYLPSLGGKLISIVNTFLAIGLLYLYSSKNIWHPSDGWNWTDFITILLGVATIVLGALGTLIAVAALWGYQQIQKSAELRSVAAVDHYLRSEEFERKLDDLIERRYEKDLALKAVDVAKGKSEGPEKDWED